MVLPFIFLMNRVYSSEVSPLLSPPLFPSVIYCLTPPVSGEADAKTTTPVLRFILYYMLSPEFTCSYGHFFPPTPKKWQLYPNQSAGAKNDAKNQTINLLSYYVSGSSQCLF